LPQGAFHKAERLAAAADVLVCVGTSGVVYPAAGIPSVARAGGATVVTVNLERSAKLRGTNDFSIQGAAGDVLPMLVEAATGESAP
jgi:NAD-dependent deacetylase